MSFFLRVALLWLALAWLAPLSAAFTPNLGREFNEDMDLTELSLEELMDMEVTVVSRSSTSLSELPAAVYVLTGDEIRRSGHASVQEAMRMVPGFYVSQWTTNNWDVTARGFGTGLALTNQAYLNQLLVMIDGVVVYSPQFAGVWWALQDIPMSDIDRIEVVKGPAGILWGSNAVHGVVNVITKRSEDTLGLRVDARYGTQDRNLGLRYGGKLGKTGTYRAWARTKQQDTLENPFYPFDYDWLITSAGARFEWQGAGRDFTVWTRAWDETNGNAGFDLTTFDPIQVYDDKQGVQLSASMANPEAASQWTAWFSVDRQDMPTLLDSSIEIFDVKYEKQVELGKSHDINFGGGYRLVHSNLVGADPFYLDFDPQDSTQDTFRAFAVDTISLVEDVTSLTVGVSALHNDFTGIEVQPTLRGTWWPREEWMVWGGVSRAVRTPSLEERNLSATSYFAGNDQFISEELVAYEFGSRALPTSWLTLDLALFYNFYDNLHLEVFNALAGNYDLENDAEGQTWGGELAADFDVTRRWRIRSGYAYLNGVFEQKSTGDDIANESKSPEHTFNLRSYYDLGSNWELDSGIYVIDGMGPGFELAEYVRIDVRLGWNPSDAFKLYLGVQNLNQELHSEFDEFDNIRRNVYAGLEWTP